MRSFALVLFVVIVGGLAASPMGCSSTGPTSPVECDSGGVTCTRNSTCCPAAQPFYCGAPTDIDNLGCYATLEDAAAICSTETGLGGGTANAAYQCH
jgi:hypothetical protein